MDRWGWMAFRAYVPSGLALVVGVVSAWLVSGTAGKPSAGRAVRRPTMGASRSISDGDGAWGGCDLSAMAVGTRLGPNLRL